MLGLRHKSEVQTQNNHTCGHGRGSGCRKAGGRERAQARETRRTQWEFLEAARPTQSARCVYPNHSVTIGGLKAAAAPQLQASKEFEKEWWSVKADRPPHMSAPPPAETRAWGPSCSDSPGLGPRGVLARAGLLPAAQIPVRGGRRPELVPSGAGPSRSVRPESRALGPAWYLGKT